MTKYPRISFLCVYTVERVKNTIIIMTSRIQQLIKLCMQEKASEAERNELLRLLQAAENEGEAKKMINEALNCPGEEGVLSGSGVGLPGDDRGISEDVSAAILEAIFQSDDGRQGEAADDGQQGEVGRVIVRPVIARLAIFRWVPYAAAVLLFIICGVVLLSKRKTQPGVITSQKSDPVKDILPGGNKAILTLADGATINLDDAKKGDIARDGNARIVKPGNNGILVYHPMPGNRQTLVYNTVTTPRGGQYQLSLSDGSKVWLNASSSIHFPTTFNGQERAVELTGEGYFEIARNTAMPFVVKANGVTVQVLGTHFNINAYNDEGAVRTTLIEGVVRVATAEQALMLKAGQQAAAVGEQALAAAVGEQALAAAGKIKALIWKK